MPDEAPTIATVLKSMGYATGQFGKNHLGDLNQYLPTLHGFDEFFGYLYHLDAMEDPSHPNYPAALKDKIGPRNMVHSWATDKDDSTVDPRWGKVGKQRIEDAGTLYPYCMETVDDEILQHALDFIDKAKAAGKPFFVWLNPTRMHVVTHLSDKYEKLRTPENGWSVSEAGMVQLDDIVGTVMEKLKADGLDDDTVVVFTTENGAENFTWPDGGQTPFAGGKGTVLGPSARHEFFYFAEGTLGAVRVNDYKYRFIDQPGGWLGGTTKPDMPILTNLRLDPFERTGLAGSLNYYSWFVYQFWRFVLVQEVVAKLAQTAIEFAPMQPGASFNLDAVKDQIQAAIASHAGK